MDRCAVSRQHWKIGAALELSALFSTIANGMLPILAKNISSGQSAKVSMIAFTPKSQIVTLAFTADSEDAFSVGGSSRKATRYKMKNRNRRR